MPGWAKIVSAAIVVSLLGLVLAVMFNPLSIIDARYGRGSQAVTIGGHVAAGRCDQVALPRSGNATRWSEVCGAMAEMLDADAEPTISERGANTRPDDLGLVSTKTYGYTLEVLDRRGSTRELAITLDEDNRLLHAAIDRVTISPGGAVGYDNQHRYEPNFGFTSLDVSATTAGPSGAELLNEALIDVLANGDCAAFHAERGSNYLSETITEDLFVEFCRQVGPFVDGAELGYGPVRLVMPAGGGAEIAATDVALTSAGATAARLFIGHDFENGEWRLRSVFFQEDQLFYAGSG